MHNRHRLVLGILLCGFAKWAAAGPITYDVTVDTSSISGTAGALDFNFASTSTPLAEAASLQVLGFTGSGTLAGTPSLTGDVAGNLPATVTFDNATSNNDYFEGFTFGSSLSFQVSLYGPALSSPNGLSPNGSSFQFSMFSNAAGSVPVLTTDTTFGEAFTISVNPDGSTTVVNNSTAFTGISPVESGVPEPTTWTLVGAAMAGLWVWRARQVRRDSLAATRTVCD
jgi:hypothetical protein